MASSQNQFYKTINIRGSLIELNRPLIMGIMNITPDSFFEQSRSENVENCLQQCNKLLSEGADIIDLGAQSTRPGAERISAEEEWNRLQDILEELVAAFPSAAFSIDTFYSEVAEKSINAGAAIINDISGGEIDPKLFDCIAALGVPYVLSHIKGTPQTMSQHANYTNIAQEVVKKLSGDINRLHQLGVKDIIIDPGFGFAKNIEHNFELLANLKQLELLEKPILIGLSRKSMIWKPLETTPEFALNGTTALHMAALERGASMLRVHDVKEAVETVKLFQRLRQAGFNKLSNQ